MKYPPYVLFTPTLILSYSSSLVMLPQELGAESSLLIDNFNDEIMNQHSKMSENCYSNVHILSGRFNEYRMNTVS